MSAPSLSGFCISGVANTLSTITSAPPACAISETAAISTRSSVGLAGVSKKNARVLGRMARCQAAVSRPSTSVQSMPKRGHSSCATYRHEPNMARAATM